MNELLFIYFINEQFKRLMAQLIDSGHTPGILEKNKVNPKKKNK